MATGTAVDVVMPQMGVSVSEGTVTKWLRQVGDEIRADDNLLEISTDKVDTEVPSPGTGILQEILVPEGETVAVGTVLARIGTGEAASTGAAPAAPAAPAPPAPLPSYVEPEAAPEPAPEPEPAPVPVGAAAPPPPEPAPAPAEHEDGDLHTGNGGGSGRPPFVSPVVARIAAEHGIDPRTVPGTGRDGRVTKKDILGFVETGEPSPTSEPAAAPAPEPAAAATPEPAAAPAAPPAPSTAAPPSPPPPAQPAPAPALEPGDTLTPMTVMRRGIAEHMRRSLDTGAHVTSAIEVDMAKVVAIRERLKRDVKASHGINLTYLAFVARATVDTLLEWPLANAEIRGESIVTRNYVNLGFAVALDEGKGLIVPVLKHAEDLNLLGVARGVADLADRARTKRLLPDDVQGGTFTITNPGGYGTFIGTPVISQPQSAILGTYALIKRPWVITDDAGQDAIAIRPIMNLTLTYDHRLVDGAYAGQFLHDVTERLESWGEADY